MSTPRQVVVTGMGMVTPIGFDEETFWSHLVEGRTGIDRIRQIDVSDYKVKIGAEVDSERLSAALNERGLFALDRTVDMGLLASNVALEQAGLIEGEPPYSKSNVAALFGTGAGNGHSYWDAYMRFEEMRVKGIRPTTIPRLMANSVSAQISMRFGLTGPNYVTVCACSSASVAIGTGYRLIKDGYADTALCGGTEAIFDFGTFGGWNKLGVLSKNPDPERACRPFDEARDGCVLGEGAGALVLESAERARERRASVRAEIIGYAESSDAVHLTRPDPEGQARTIRLALASAGLEPGDVGFINAHGTATKANDACEGESIRLAFGEARRI
ncbi:MAG: beta-ketoacyl-[acyl-carrier-protein] synthase family protein, partial [Verrucomicrobiota bacterium]